MLSDALPKVSIVIPNYNRADCLERCLDSLVAQTFNDFEVIICDDGSTDNSEEVVNRYVDRLNLKFETAINFGGPARPRNLGIVSSRAPYIAFLDSDDWWTPNKLFNSIPLLEAGADLVYHDLYIVSSKHQTKYKRKIRSTHPKIPMFHSLLCTGFSIPNSSVIIRKKILEQIGGITEDKDLISVEDYDTWIRVSKITEKFVRLDTCDGYYWVGGGNISAASQKQQSKIKKLYSQYIETLPINKRDVAEKFLTYRVARIAQNHNDFATAINSYLKVIGSSLEFRYQLKALILLTQTLWNQKIN